MKKVLFALLAATTIGLVSCDPAPYRHGDLAGYHYGKGNRFNGKYRGARHRYNWESHSRKSRGTDHYGR